MGHICVDWKSERYFLSVVSYKYFFNAVLPVMLSSKLLPEMEVEDNAKREQLLHSMQNLSVASQIEKLKVGSSQMLFLLFLYPCGILRFL